MEQDEVRRRVAYWQNELHDAQVKTERLKNIKSPTMAQMAMFVNANDHLRRCNQTLANFEEMIDETE